MEFMKSFIKEKQVFEILLLLTFAFNTTVGTEINVRLSVNIVACFHIFINYVLFTSCIKQFVSLAWKSSCKAFENIR